MEYRTLGKSGLKISTISLGTNNFGGRCDMAQTQAVVDKAIEVGVTMFDTADAYPTDPHLWGKSEEFLGKALGKRRKDVVVASKFGMPMGEGPYMVGGSRRYIMNAVEASLKRLGTDYIDLYQMHFPDPSTPMEETLRALDDLVRQGKIRYIGGCNFKGHALVDAMRIADEIGAPRFISMQNFYNILRRDVEDERLPAARLVGAGFLPYFPLASGLLTGKYKRGEKPPAGSRFGEGSSMAGLAGLEMNDRQLDLVEKIEAFGKERGLSVLEIAVAWLLAQPGVASVMAGATKPGQVEQNVAAAGAKLSAEDVQKLGDITKPQGGLPF
ncbi:MAG: aldo/keto reductase [Alphaproteobacteria bacterium]|nr:aldo/keto reductase [Alphaproteobacteria bacterium]